MTAPSQTTSGANRGAGPSAAGAPLGDAGSEPQPAPPSVRPRRHSRLVARYLATQMVLPTLVALAGFAMAVLAPDLLTLVDLVANRGFGIGEVAALAGWKALPLFGEMLPFAVLVGVLVALGRLGADRELLVLEASGVSPRSLAVPIVAFGAFWALVSLGLSLVAGPASLRALDGALVDIARRNPSTQIVPGAKSSFGSWRIQARDVSLDGDLLEGVALWSPDVGETIFAERATLAPADHGGLHVDLETGTVLMDSGDQLTQVRFDHMRQTLPARSAGVDLDADWSSMATLAELGAIAREGNDPRRGRQARAEWHRRLALPIATLLFGVLALPLSLARKSVSRSGGAVLGLAVTVVYYGLVQLAYGLTRGDALPVAPIVWLPNALLGVAAVLLFFQAPRLSSMRGDGRGAARRAGGGRALGRGRFILARYVVRLFAEMAVLCGSALLVAYLLVDVVDNLQWFTKYESTLAEIARFYSARVPVLAARVFPLALLAGAALTLSMLAVRGELIAIRACGISTLRVVVPILVICALLSVVYYGMVNELAPRANAMASHLKNTEIKNRNQDRGSVWFRVGSHLYEAEELDPLRGLASQITIYQLGRDGMPLMRTDSTSARHVGEGVWRLDEPIRVEVDGADLREIPPTTLAQLGSDVPAEIDTSHLTPGQLAEEIRELAAGGYNVHAFRVDLAVKRAAPLACWFLPALALLFAATGPPFPTPIQTLLWSGLVAVLHIGLTALGSSLGRGGQLTPELAGWVPAGALALLTGAMVVRARRYGQGL